MREYTKESLFELRCNDKISLYHNSRSIRWCFEMVGDYYQENGHPTFIDLPFPADDVELALIFVDRLLIPRSDQKLITLLVVVGYLGLNKSYSKILTNEVVDRLKTKKSVSTIRDVTLPELVEKLRDPEHLCAREREINGLEAGVFPPYQPSPQKAVEEEHVREIPGPQGPPGESIVGPQGPQGPPGPRCRCRRTLLFTRRKGRRVFMR